MKQQRLGRGKKKNSQRSHGVINRPIYARASLSGQYWLKYLYSIPVKTNRY